MRIARELEVEHMQKLRACESATIARMQLMDDKRFLRGGWASTRAAPSASRSAAGWRRGGANRHSSIAAGGIAGTLAATPPLEGVRWLISVARSGQVGVRTEAQRVLRFYDVLALVCRRIYMKTTPEDSTMKIEVGRRVQTMRGTSGAGQCFDAFSQRAMRALVCEVGDFNRCL